jgi:hypothetical protein
MRKTETLMLTGVATVVFALSGLGITVKHIFNDSAVRGPVATCADKIRQQIQLHPEMDGKDHAALADESERKLCTKTEKQQYDKDKTAFEECFGLMAAGAILGVVGALGDTAVVNKYGPSGKPYHGPLSPGLPRLPGLWV